MPLKKDTGEVALDRCNFWLIDERLAFHSYLASDKEHHLRGLRGPLPAESDRIWRL